MARKRHHEEHVNTEAWAIPYGDLITLLLAFFVVMYSMSSVNEGKYRILSDSLVTAFRGSPKAETPIESGKDATGKDRGQMVGVRPSAFVTDGSNAPPSEKGGSAAEQQAHGSLLRMGQDVKNALKTLIDQKLVTVRQE